MAKQIIIKGGSPMSRRWLSGLFLALTLSTQAFGDEEFLEPEAAFRFSARLTPGERLEVHYRIADGYYLYRERFRFDVQPQSIVQGPPRIPQGEWHEDEFFGRSQIYRHEVTISIPIRSGTAPRIRLEAVSQGCADGGICYLPTRQSAEFETLGPLGTPENAR
ncbi:MAG: protein-disulfide reductase DsbD N-terminal domain-containing protein [Burkholderiales bacterium]|jgi:thiol:disulfide interchange protein DsbD